MTSRENASSDSKAHDASHTAVAAAITWKWDSVHQLYFSPESGTYAYPDQNTGQWVYVPASSFASTSSSSSRTVVGSTVPGLKGEKEDGEIEDDVGWGGLMEPEQLDKALKKKLVPYSNGFASHYGVGAVEEKHPAYGGARNDPLSRELRESRGRSASPQSKETPNHLLRLVVIESPSLNPGDVAVIDAREGGIQIGRDRCEKGGHPRVRVKEMEVSKTHAVVYWAQGEDGEEGWCVVDLGSTHGTFVTATSACETNGVDDDIDGEPMATPTVSRPYRLSEPKVSSLPYSLSHMSTLSLGQTHFQVHSHPSWPCEACQLGKGNEIALDTGETKDITDSTLPGSNIKGNGYAMNSQQKRDNREVTRKQEMANLRNSLLNLNPSSSIPKEGVNDGQNRYVDRSALRRRMRPRSPPPRRTDTGTAAALPTPSEPAVSATSGSVSSFAQNMLAAQGWAPGAGLGRDQSGRSEAIEVKMRVEKRGLGAQGAEVAKDDVNEDWRKRAKQRRFEQMKG